MEGYEKLDQEWVDLMVEAKELGIGLKELQEFLQSGFYEKQHDGKHLKRAILISDWRNISESKNVKIRL
ncbi:anti-repressor SinI family protein [Virgibacillus senegalensis]|uniref:anti-repressor SinI family protein n=1 Tax=Virgibacillus senegalensis TaxID=1499679 RepID=UPI00069EE650|nr:anti-repressor SinI family protein [Virgibacillus senegalensis]